MRSTVLRVGRRRATAVLLVTATALAAVLAGAAAAGAAPAASTAAARPLPRAIDVTAAQPYVASPTYGALPTPDYEALWSLALADGQQIIVKMTMPAGQDFDLALWPPGTTTIGTHSSAAAISWSFGSDPEALKYVVPAGLGGVYYIDVWSSSAPSDPNYRFSVNIQSPGGRATVTAPAVRSTMRVGRNYSSYGTLKPLHLAGDQTVKVQWQKRVNGRWRSGGTMRPENMDYGSYTRYKVAYKFYGWGSGSMRWRVRAIHLADEMHPRAVSAWRYFVVKN